MRKYRLTYRDPLCNGESMVVHQDFEAESDAAARAFVQKWEKKRQAAGYPEGNWWAPMLEEVRTL